MNWLMTVKFQRAAVSPKLIVVLVLTVIVAGGFWIVRSRGGSDLTMSEPMTIYCPTCGEQETNKPKWKGAKFLCPKCNEYIATYDDPSVAPPDVMNP